MFLKKQNKTKLVLFFLPLFAYFFKIQFKKLKAQS